MKKRIVPIILLIVLILSGIWSLTSVLSIQGNARVINYTGVIRGGSQLLIKEELHGDPNDTLIKRLDEIIDELMTGKGDNRLALLPDREYINAMSLLKECWLEVRNEILKLRQGGDAEELYQLSEELFQQADLAVSAAEFYTEKQVAITVKIFCALFLLVAVGTCLYIANEIRNQRKIKLMEADGAKNQREKEQLEKMSVVLRSSLNDLSELMYAADLETYNLLFFNEVGLRNFGLDSYEGKKCYQVLRGRDTPCEDCEAHTAPNGETYTWEDTNPVTGRHYMLKDRDILWDGRPARLEIAFDMTKVEAEKQSLKYMLQTENLIMECVHSLYQSPQFAAAVPGILERLGSFLEAERSYIFLVRDELAYNDFEWCKPGIVPQKENLQGLPLSFFDSWMPRFDCGECVLITDLEQIKDSSPEEYEILNRQNIHSLVAAPLERDGKFCGCLGVDNPPQKHLAYISTMLQTLCYFLMLSIERTEDEEKLAHLSYHDTLTSFFNRNRYMKDSEALQNSNIPVGIVFLDVNGLKDVNDKRGHAYGDKLLKEAARRIQEVFSDADLYRIGGDEFVIICKQKDETQFNDSVRQLKERFQTDNYCCAAIGSQWSAKLCDMNELTSQADALMYENKKEFYRKNPATRRYRHQYDNLLELTNPSILESEINKNRFAVYLQPKVSSNNRTAIGAEALIRYHPEEGSVILPGNFLPLLEETQTVSQIDFFVFELVCSKIKKWLDMGKEVFPVSINFSQHTLAQPSFVKQLCTICEKYEVSPKLLEIEITDIVLEAGECDLLSLIHQMRQAGFIVALADFGTDSEDLNLLTSADFDVLKLDKAMISDISKNPETRSFIASIVKTCRERGIRLVAEGIETEEQVNELRNCGVEFLQGFLFSKPISMEEYEYKYLL